MTEHQEGDPLSLDVEYSNAGKDGDPLVVFTSPTGGGPTIHVASSTVHPRATAATTGNAETPPKPERRLLASTRQFIQVIDTELATKEFAETADGPHAIIQFDPHLYDPAMPATCAAAIHVIGPYPNAIEATDAAAAAETDVNDGHEPDETLFLVIPVAIHPIRDIP